ncbi:hypothetical protein PPYR_11148 [Photinus pyralis]|uniref:Myb-like, SWIRM and MPN domain-containing protein 1 n=2 Tax=Photinus pyralis TaxID=7054 RepID=A0A1Y1NBG0_PHOPY|nr:histone H2A deubiquitinase MYSM1-like [Photinus pyralis]KAB0794309.1 hypothetical protein PPYR_11148 [Photinus pyralis]
MADDDEIDILGDFSLDNFLSKNDSEIYNNTDLVSHTSEILNCNCSSEWFLEQNSSTNSCCYNSAHSDLDVDLGQEPIQNVDKHQILTENTITDASGWTKREKNLLERGIEIFGKSGTRLAQFIGTKTASEVKHYLKYFHTEIVVQGLDGQPIIEETVVTSDNLNLCDDGAVLDDFEIPASIEEVIAAVSTAKPTIAVGKRTSKKSQNLEAKPKVNYGHGKRGNMHRQIQPAKRSKKDGVKFKFCAKLKASDVQKVKKKNMMLSAPVDNSYIQNTLPFDDIHSINGEEVVKISKESTDEDIDLDVENDDNHYQNISSKNVDVAIANKIGETDKGPPVQKEHIATSTSTVAQGASMESTSSVQHSDLNVGKEIYDLLTSMDCPTCEVILGKDEVTDLEKYVHDEYFNGRTVKTPKRYLKIRNHILNAWTVGKPAYVTKTSVRQGLKNCGDVNCIGRIHYFLEQIGAINFGCADTIYIRPLRDWLMVSAPFQREKPQKSNTIALPKAPVTNRQRIRKKLLHDGQGGYTLTHNENGDVINTTIVSEEPVVKQRTYVKTPTIRLIYCKAFSEESPQQFQINLHLQALLLMDLHAHTSTAEVMGLIGGYWNPDSKIMTILRYVPCRNIASSATHCDMCPISQAKAADMIHDEGFNILGWFHSHPTFAPEPSQQDLDTQLTVQQWIGHNKPCVGVILSPFSAHGALIASPYRCLIVAKKHNFEDQFVPYKFKVELISSNLDSKYLLGQAWNIMYKASNVPEKSRVDFKRAYFLDQSITFCDKFISSVKMHLAKCSDVNKTECDKITQGFANICYS